MLALGKWSGYLREGRLTVAFARGLFGLPNGSSRTAHRKSRAPTTSTPSDTINVKLEQSYRIW